MLKLILFLQNLPQSRKSSAFRTVWRRIYIHDEYAYILQSFSHTYPLTAGIRKTANVSGVELSERFRNTAFYATLCAILPREYQPEGYETLPDVALLAPTPAETTSRWPGMSPDQVEALIQDYNLESDQLR
jgi:nuclear pore complex protein Nup133